jgi:predicted dehydrogenase
MKNIKLGIVGVRRGGDFKSVCDAMDGVRIHAVCDVNEDALAKSKDALGAEEAYLDYGEMLDKSDLDAVLISTPMNLHVPQSIAALTRNIHVLSEVTAGISVDECKDLVQICKDFREADYRRCAN